MQYILTQKEYDDLVNSSVTTQQLKDQLAAVHRMYGEEISKLQQQLKDSNVHIQASNRTEGSSI